MRFDKFLRAADRTPPAVVLDVSSACGLEIVRGLGRNGVPVLALDRDPAAVGLRSRYAAGAVCPDAGADEEAFVTYLDDLGRRLPQRAVLFPSSDEFVWPLSMSAERLAPSWITPFSRWDVMQRLHDRRAQIEAAQRLGLDTPRTTFVGTAARLAAAAAEISFPVIIEPVGMVASEPRLRRRHIVVPTSADLERVSAELDDLGTLMLQEVVPGADDNAYTVGSYLDTSSRALAVFTGRTIRRRARGGACLAAQSEWAPDLADVALRLLQELHYHGVSHVEFKRDARDGRHRLLRVAPRPWEWHGLATASGVNLSLAAYSDAVGRSFLTPHQVDDNKWIVINHDVPEAVGEIVRGRRDPAAYLRALRGTRLDGLHALADPLPGVIDGCRALKQAVTKRPRSGFEE